MPTHVKLFILIAFILNMSFISCQEKKRKRPFDLITYDNVYRLGPVLFKFDKEWMFSKNGRSYIRIGLGKQDIYSEQQTSMYDLISIQSMSSTASDKILANSNRIQDFIEITSYDIECNNNLMWIDLNFIIANRYDKYLEQNIIKLIYPYKLYFYNPIVDNWWGFTRRTELNLILFEELFTDSIEVDKIYNIFGNNDNTKIFESIINNRTLNLPRMKFFNSNFKKINERFLLYCWYEEKKEEIAPMDE